MPRRLKTCYAKLHHSVPWPVIPPAEPAVEPAVESVEPMPDSGDSSSHYDEELPSSESEEEEVEMPATWAERQQMGILHSWNTCQAEETRA
jgi:hypothetical protein